MAEMNTEWQKTKRDDGVQEYFWPGEFIQSDTFHETSPPVFRPRTYPYYKDGFSYNGVSYPFDNEIHVTEMTHATSFECMLSIIKEGGFRSKEKDCPGIRIRPMSLVWFGLKIEEREIDRMKEHSKGEVKRQLQCVPERELIAAYVLDQIARTPAFQPLSLHGNCKFSIGIKEAMHAYREQFCPDFCDPEMTKLGTFVYRQEIMHAIVVCPPKTLNASICPYPFHDPVIQPDGMLETWTWRPHSTQNMSAPFYGSDHPSYIRWEHVSFAFYVPDGSVLHIPNLEQRVSLCLERKGSNLSFVYRDIMRMLEVLNYNVFNRKSRVDTLIRMIAAYLKDERLYEKTMVKNTFEANVVVDLERVVLRVRQFLTPREFEELDWGPLNEWMNSLTRHSNVLRDIQRAEIRL